MKKTTQEIDSSRMKQAQKYYNKYLQSVQIGQLTMARDYLHEAVKLDPLAANILEVGFPVFNEVEDEALAFYNSHDYGSAYELLIKYSGFDECVDDEPLKDLKNKCLATFKEFRHHVDKCLPNAKSPEKTLAYRIDTYNEIITCIRNDDPAHPGERNKMKILRAELLPPYKAELITNAQNFCSQHNFKKALEVTQEGAKYVPELAVFQALPIYVKICQQQSNRKPLIDDHLITVFKAAHADDDFMQLIKPLGILKVYNRWVSECQENTLNYPERFKLINNVLLCANDYDTQRLTKLRNELIVDYRKFLCQEVRDFCNRDQFKEAKALSDEALDIFPNDPIIKGIGYCREYLETLVIANKERDANVEEKATAVMMKITDITPLLKGDNTVASLHQDLTMDLRERMTHHKDEITKISETCALMVEQIVLAALASVNIDKAKGKNKKCTQPMDSDYQALCGKITDDFFNNDQKQTMGFLHYYLRQEKAGVKEQFVRSAARCLINCVEFKKKVLGSNVLVIHPNNYEVGSFTDAIANFIDRMSVGVDAFVKSDNPLSPIYPPRRVIKPSQKQSSGWNVHPSVQSDRSQTMVFHRGSNGQRKRSGSPPSYNSVIDDNNSNNDTNSSEALSTSPEKDGVTGYGEVECVF